MNKLDSQYLDLLRTILRDGKIKKDRTGTGTQSIFGYQIRHDMADGFPLLTTKKVHFKGIITELLWFLKGDTNIAYLIENGCNIWNGDAYKKFKTTLEECAHPACSPEEFAQNILDDQEFAEQWGYLGPIYGAQWRRWHNIEFEDKYRLKDNNVHNRFDQIAMLINDLRNNPDSRRLMVSAWNVGQINQMTLPPCFAPETLINTKQGYKQIKNISRGDLVLSTFGKYEMVTEVFKTKYNGSIIKVRTHGSPFPIYTTPNHPFWTDKQTFIDAGELTTDMYLAFPINKEEILPIFTYEQNNQYKKWSKNIDVSDLDFWFVLGYYLGDGWMIKKKQEINFSIRNDQIDTILPLIRKFIKVSKKKNNNSINVTTFNTISKRLFKIFDSFGYKAEGKIIPEWVLNAPINYITKFIEGYNYANGCTTKEGSFNTTISQHIAFGIQLLHAKIKSKVGLYYQIRPTKTTIENRIVNQKNTFTISKYLDKNNSKNYYFSDNFLYVKIIGIEKESYNDFVYNLSVNNTHTYTANNLFNHNCHYGFQCYTTQLTQEERFDWYFENKKPNRDCVDAYDELCVEDREEFLDNSEVPKRRLSLMWNQRSVDTPLGLPFNIASYGLLLSLLAKHVNMIPDQLIGNLGDTHIYLNQMDGVKEQLTRTGFDLPKLIIEKAEINDISDYQIDHIQLFNYQSGPKINFPLSN